MSPRTSQEYSPLTKDISHGEITAPQQQQSHGCTRPTIRRSWLTLTNAEKKNYIDAVKCLSTKPSYMVPNTTLHDDFTWIHIKDGNFQHFAAGNLPWHRMHLHLYEQALRNECGYDGYLIYWDWETEYLDPYSSNIFDPETGFGGNGDTSGPYVDQTHGDKLDQNRCVLNGPFKDLTVAWYAAFPLEGPMDVRSVYHCLTRSFAPNFKDLKAISGTFTDIAFSPARLEEIMQTDDYNTFNFAMEVLHTWLPKAVLGDFATLSATNDPLFYPHLANIDRLWWKWQQKDGQKNMMKYGGPAVLNTEIPSSLDDPMPFPTFPGMPRTLQAKHLMKTESEMFCYRY
ncbi:Di-copper centre-containing protein [Mollisia scopiformis]|uniref:Di-copper centre-containing protein n=1 Tax=Mollisia scopiformis TaxID=149040 RepID=A0A194XSF1_MOLSC|nr:Di-copper centre-containing protein [Mollisia scopiformis]KUJ23230.1 Di-copper centre-containing protein [Mollisia scopiformis]